MSRSRPRRGVARPAVLHVIDSLTGGGAEESLRSLLAATSDHVQHLVALLRPDEDGVAFLEDEGIPAFVPPSTVSRLQAVRHVRAAVREMSPDLVHTTLFEADLAGRIAGRLARVPVLTSLVNVPYGRRPAVRAVSAWKRYAIQYVDGVLSRHATTHFHAVTEEVASESIRTLRVPPERVTVVGRGRDRARLGAPGPERRSRVRRELGIDEGTFLILNVGREEPQKGQAHLLRAVAALGEHRPDMLCLIAGRAGRSSGDLDRLTRELRLESRLWRMGFRDDVPDLLCAVDVLAFPSEHEGAAGAVLEAMALCVPIVAAAMPSLDRLLEHGRLGVTVDVRDPVQFAAALATVTDTTAPWARRTTSASAAFDERHSLKGAAEAMVDLWRTVARGG